MLHPHVYFATPWFHQALFWVSPFDAFWLFTLVMNSQSFSPQQFQLANLLISKTRIKKTPNIQSEKNKSISLDNLITIVVQSVCHKFDCMIYIWREDQAKLIKWNLKKYCSPFNKQFFMLLLVSASSLNYLYGEMSFRNPFLKEKNYVLIIKKQDSKIKNQKSNG